MRQTAEITKHLTPPAIARRLGVAAETVIGWIRSGELIGSNVAKPSCTRPRFRVDPTDLAAFLAARRPDAPPAVKPARRRKQMAGVIEFY
jgi:hypothetical protein